MFANRKLQRYALALVAGIAAATAVIAPAALAGTHVNSGAHSVTVVHASRSTTVSPDDTPWG